MDRALKALADYDNANAKLQTSGDKKDVARFHVGRIPLLNAIVKVAKDPEDQLSYRKQIVDSLVAAYQTGENPKVRQVLEGMIDEGTKLSSYAAYRLDRRRVRACGTRSREATSWPTRRSGWPSSRAS